MSQWLEVKLGDYVNLLTGFPFKSKNYSDFEEDIKLLRGDNIAQGYLRWENVKRWKLTDDPRESNYFLKTNDVILAMDRPWIEAGLKYSIISNKDLPCLLVQRVACLRAKEILNQQFLRYVIGSKSFTEYVCSIETGTAVPHISGQQIKDYEFLLPPIPEQKAIASVLSSLDDKIDLLHRQNKTLEAMAETLFRQWFIEEAEEDWKIYQLQDLAKIQIGRTPPRKESHWFSDNPDDMKWVSIKDLGADGIFVTYSSEYLPLSTIDHFHIPIIPKGTVMLSFKMTVGRVGIAIEDMVSNEAIAQFQIRKHLTNELLYCFLKQFNFDTLGSTSSIVTAVNTALLKGIELALPEDAVIQIFTKNVKSYFDKVRANQIQIQTLEQLRDTLLPKLMSGEVRVQYQTGQVA